jgi:hypothetical protein
MRWNKEGKHDSKDPDIISHLADSEAWETMCHIDPEFAWDLGVSALACRWMVSNLIASLAVHNLTGQFLSCLRICRRTNV